MPRPLALAALAAVVLAGSALRLVWPADMEYKQDEAWSYEMTRRVGTVDPFPAVGMPSSTGTPNFGLSVWQFLGLSWAFDLGDPVQLVRAIEWLNVGGLAMFALLVLTAVPRGEREVWLWAVALAAVNPLAIVIQRKIWPISTMPPLTLVMALAFCRRDARAGAFGWGLLTALLGQLHVSSAVFGVGFVAWALVRRRTLPTRWGWAVGGALMGALPAVPWALYLASPPADRFDTHLMGWFADYVRTKEQTGTMALPHLFEFKFFLRWLTEPLGFGWGYTLGADYAEYAADPAVTAGRWACVGGAVAVGTRALLSAWRRRPDWRLNDSWTASVVGAALCGGIVLTLMCVPVHRHYLNALYPATFVGLAALALWRGPTRLARVALAALVIGQGVQTFGLLRYVHALDRPVRGEYGESYREQARNGRVFPLNRDAAALPGARTSSSALR